MKITVLQCELKEEEEIVIKCTDIDEDIRALIEFARKKDRGRLKCMKGTSIFLVDEKDVFYFESVDDETYAYTKDEVYKIDYRLYELEEMLGQKMFMRASKATILNISCIESLSPAMGGRLEALLENGEKTIISRQYVPVLKKKLGI